MLGMQWYIEDNCDDDEEDGFNVTQYTSIVCNKVCYSDERRFSYQGKMLALFTYNIASYYKNHWFIQVW